MGKKKGKKSVTIKMDWNEFAQMSGSGGSVLPVAPSQSSQSATQSATQSTQSGDRAWGRCRQGSGHNDSRASVPEAQYPISRDNPSDSGDWRSDSQATSNPRVHAPVKDLSGNWREGSQATSNPRVHAPVKDLSGNWREGSQPTRNPVRERAVPKNHRSGRDLSGDWRKDARPTTHRSRKE